MEEVDFKKYFEEISPRIDALYKNNYKIESFLLSCAVFEKLLQSLVSQYDKLAKYLLKFHDVNFYIKKSRRNKDTRELTIG